MKVHVAVSEPKLGRGPIPVTVLAIALIAALLLGIDLYFPALSGPFVFDDFTLPYQRTVAGEPLSAWLNTAGVRPFLIFTYWLNYKLSGDSPVGYHALNLVIHVLNTALVFLVFYRLLEVGGWLRAKRIAAAGIGAAVFLVHPLQTESVSYVAGRSESLAALFILSAYVLFLYRKHAQISWHESLFVIALLGLGVTTKENAVSMAGLMILTDVFWPTPFSTRGLRDNWRLYALMVPGAIVAVVGVLKVLVTSSSAGFSVPVTWYQYGFTEARAIFTYLRLALLPFGQSIDHDYPISHTIWEYGAIFYLVLLAFIAGFCVARRKRYPFACFGLLTMLILLAPTSSIVPIADALAERRMYLPLMGLIFIGFEFAGRARVPAAVGYPAIVAMVAVFAALCYQRNELWGQPSELLGEAAMRSTTKVRPYINLVDQLIQERRCDRAVPYLRHADDLFPNDYAVQLAWGRTLECVGRRDEALQRLRRAAAIQPSSYVYQLIGLLYGEMGDHAQAGMALQKAVESDPGSVGAHDAFGFWYESVDNLKAAEKEYRTSLSLDRYDRAAQIGIARVRQATMNR